MKKFIIIIGIHVLVLVFGGGYKDRFFDSQPYSNLKDRVRSYFDTEYSNKIKLEDLKIKEDRDKLKSVTYTNDTLYVNLKEPPADFDQFVNYFSDKQNHLIQLAYLEWIVFKNTDGTERKVKVNYTNTKSNDYSIEIIKDS
jgi:hypothetical protein